MNFKLELYPKVGNGMSAIRVLVVGPNDRLWLLLPVLATSDARLLSLQLRTFERECLVLGVKQKCCGGGSNG
jgi:hypothetical protein